MMASLKGIAMALAFVRGMADPVATRIGPDRYRLVRPDGSSEVLRTAGCTVTAFGHPARLRYDGVGRGWLYFVGEGDPCGLAGGSR